MSGFVSSVRPWRLAGVRKSFPSCRTVKSTLGEAWARVCVVGKGRGVGTSKSAAPSSDLRETEKKRKLKKYKKKATGVNFFGDFNSIWLELRVCGDSGECVVPLRV